MHRPQTLSQITDLPAGGASQDILIGQAQALMTVDSLVVVYMNRATIDVAAQIKAGSDEVFPNGPSAIDAVDGAIPITPNNNVVITAVEKGERIQVIGTNADAVNPQELRVLVKIWSIDSVTKMPALLSNI